jgi:hypothetical protein
MSSYYVHFEDLKKFAKCKSLPVRIQCENHSTPPPKVNHMMSAAGFCMMNREEPDFDGSGLHGVPISIYRETDRSWNVIFDPKTVVVDEGI